MKQFRWFEGIILTALAVALIILGVLYGRQNTQLKQTRAELAVLQGSPAQSTAPAGSVSPSPATEIVTAFIPVVVRVDGVGPGFTVSGSGTIVDKRGYVLTNQHVIDQTTSLTVTVGAQQYPATIIAADATRDLALLKMTTSLTNFPVVPLGATSDIVVGEDVLAFGFPLGDEFAGAVTVTAGIVSAMRSITGLEYVQNDAAINPGNSGGCLVTLGGKMIGVTSAGYDNGNDVDLINLAIPIVDVSAFLAKYLPA